MDRQVRGLAAMPDKLSLISRIDTVEVENSPKLSFDLHACLPPNNLVVPELFVTHALGNVHCSRQRIPGRKGAPTHHSASATRRFQLPHLLIWGFHHIYKVTQP